MWTQIRRPRSIICWSTYLSPQSVLILFMNQLTGELPSNIGNLTKLKELVLFNETDLIHKLSHQELHIKFWILKTSTLIKDGVKWSDIRSYPVPIVIERFINNFQN